VHSGEVKVTFTLSPTSYIGRESVSGRDFDVIVAEMRRRRGFNAVNSALCLTYDGSVKTDDVGF
jgi:hypothetical protein